MKQIFMAGMITMAALPVGAQQRPRSDSLPRELVVALLGGSAVGRTVDVQAGIGDDSLPQDLFRDARVLGSADYRVSRTTVAYFPYSSQATLDTIKARLVAAGWSVPELRQDTTRGFATEFSGSLPQAICREGLYVIPTVMIRMPNQTLAVIRRSRSETGNPFCNRDRESRMYDRMNPAQNTPLPSLTAPPGMQGRGGGSSGVPDREDGMTMEARLVGPGTAQVILAHYETQFTKAGWRRVERVLSESIGASTFEITSKGVVWLCALIVNVPTPDAAHVHLLLRIR